MKDFRGVEIQTGAVIAYPGRQGSSMWMNEGTVEEIKTVTDPWRTTEVLVVRTKNTGRRTEVSRTERVVVLG